MEIPATIYVAFGAVVASIVAGFFSFLNLVSSKENKVSEFRQSWIDGLRTEIATFTASLQVLVRFKAIQASYESNKHYFEATQKTYHEVSESLAKIQLRLNPEHVRERPDSHEAKLLNAIDSARDLFSKNDLEGAFAKSKEIKEIASPFLKEEWERVKNGEDRYQRIRDGAERTIRSSIVLLVTLTIAALIFHFIYRMV